MGAGIRLLDVAGNDRPLVERWLEAEHVRRWWGDSVENLRLVFEPSSGAWSALIETDGRKVGLVLWQHPARHELDAAGLADIPTGVIDIDIMIGEPSALRRGVGSEAIRLVADRALSDPAVPGLIAAMSTDNVASLRAFEKAGFTVDRECDDPVCGRCLLVRRPGPPAPAWRRACPRDDEAIIAMSQSLSREDPGASTVEAPQVRRTLETLRAEAGRGLVVVLDDGGRTLGYAILVSYWSNELGGELCIVDELFVGVPFRNRGHGTRLLDELTRGGGLWPGRAVGVALEVSPDNRRARSLYERLGFKGRNVVMLRRSS